jgi:hypothetical protein
MIMSEWKFYGDDYLNGEGTWVRQINKDVFDILELHENDGVYTLTEAEVDISVSWIDWEGVVLSVDDLYDDSDRAFGLFNYYGYEQFHASESKLADLNEVNASLKIWGV